MTNSAYKRFSRILRRSYPSLAATAALVIALVGVPGVTAGGLLVTGKQIKNGTISTKDLRNGGVKTADIGTNAVRSADIQEGAVESVDIGEGQVTGGDIGTGQVTPEDVTMPAPGQCKFDGTATLTPSLDFQKVTDLCTYNKTDASSDLEVSWTGSVLGENGGETSGCVFQLRVDGQIAPNGGGEVFGKGVVSVSSSALFPALGTGVHVVEVWARITLGNSASNTCTVGPQKAGIGQTTVVSEVVT
jgi:hypothetical protein